MKQSLYYSIGLHIMLLLALFIGMPVFKANVAHDYAVVTDIVPISELTNVNVQKKTAKKEDKNEASKAKIPPSAVKDKPLESKPTKQEKSEKSEKAAKAEPDAEKVPIKKLEEKLATPKPRKDEVAKEKKDDKSKKDHAQDFATSILKSLDSKESSDKKPDVDFKNIEKLLQGETNKEFNEHLPMSISEIDAIKSQIVNKWNTASFSGAATEGMQVVVVIELDMNGTVLKAQAQTQSHASPYYRAFVESAVRAVHMASPLQHLTKEKYHSWREIEFRFDSSGMIY
jgi:outer membrane biosynthesis protein TonB